MSQSNLVCFEHGSVKLTQQRRDHFTVTYHLQIKGNLKYEQAATELGACLMHQAACDGLLDNREPGEK